MNNNNKYWKAIFDEYDIHSHDFEESPFIITAKEIKEATTREPRILCKQDTREKRPEIFIKNDLFILPIK
ncbi:hypothetical protein THIOM_003800, partial [Candidatus Thiomargarita nelsonii]